MDTGPTSDMWFAHIFSQSAPCLFILLTVFLKEQRFNLTNEFFLLWMMILTWFLRNLSWPKTIKTSTLFSSRSVSVFSFIFVCDYFEKRYVWREPRMEVILNMDLQLFQNDLLKWPSLSPTAFVFLSRISWCICWGLFPDSLFWSIYLSSVCLDVLSLLQSLRNASWSQLKSSDSGRLSQSCFNEMLCIYVVIDVVGAKWSFCCLLSVYCICSLFSLKFCFLWINCVSCIISLYLCFAF